MSLYSQGETARDAEAAYRAYYHQVDRGTISRIVIAWGMVFVGFLWHDLVMLADQPQLRYIVALRFGYLAICLLVVILMRRIKRDPVLFERIAVAWGIASVISAVAYYLLRQEIDITFYLVDLVAVFSFYVGMPNPPQLRAVPPLLYTLYDVVSVIVHRNEFSDAAIGVICLTFFLTNFMGILLARYAFAFRKREFLAHHEEALIRNELNRLASTDPLTGVLNRRRLLELAEEAFYRFQRYRRPFSLILMDLDSFKQINDTFGHQQGDLTLVQFSQLVYGNKRQADALGRIGGDEFCLVLPETPLTAAANLADRLVRQSASIVVRKTDKSQTLLSVSLGITEARPNDITLDQVFARADAALYAAKEGGRNQWTIH